MPEIPRLDCWDWQLLIMSKIGLFETWFKTVLSFSLSSKELPLVLVPVCCVSDWVKLSKAKKEYMFVFTNENPEFKFLTAWAALSSLKYVSLDPAS